MWYDFLATLFSQAYISTRLCVFASAKMHSSVQHSLVRYMLENCVAAIGVVAFFGARLRLRTFFLAAAE